MNLSEMSRIVESYCISCKRSLSAQLALYQCTCCSICICADCVGAARISTTSLVRLSDEQFAKEATSDPALQPVSIPTPQAASSNLQAQSNKSVKRKPLSKTGGFTFAQAAYQPSESIPVRTTRDEYQAAQRPMSPMQTPPEPILSPNEAFLSLSPTMTLDTDATSTVASVQSSVYPSHVENYPRMISANDLSESPAAYPRQHPPLRHAQTAPQPTLHEFDNDKIERFSTSPPFPMVSMTKGSDRRKSASQLWSSSLETGKKLGTSSLQTGKKLGSASLETGKKLAKNKYVKAGVKYTADLAMRTVVNGVITEVLSNKTDSSNDNGQANDDGGPGVIDQLFNSGIMSNPTNPQASQVDLSSLINPGFVMPIQPTIDPTAAINGLANNSVLMNSFQQQQSAMVGLNTALQQQNAAIAAGAQSAIQQSQQFQSDMQFQASSTLNWGTNAAVPGVTAHTYRSNAPTSNSNSSAANFQQQQRLANASAAV